MSSERPASAGPHPKPPARRGARQHPLDWAADSHAADEIWLETLAKVRRRRRRRLLAGSGCVLVIAAVAAALFLPSSRSRLDQVTVASQASPDTSHPVVLAPERRLLDDGSVVDLKPGAEIEVSYTNAARRVSLVRGEAHFEVAHNAARPFIVRAGEIEVRAVGTAFAVQLETRRVEVLVTEGRVTVERSPVAPPVSTPSTPGALAPKPPTLVGAGARVLVAREPSVVAGPVVSELSAAEIGDRLAWRAPRLEFTRTPLAEALPLVNRHNRAQIRLADPALGQVRISGILRADNLDTLLQLLEDEYALRGEWHGQDEIVLQQGR